MREQNIGGGDKIAIKNSSIGAAFGAFVVWEGRGMAVCELVRRREANIDGPRLFNAKFLTLTALLD